MDNVNNPQLIVNSPPLPQHNIGKSKIFLFLAFVVILVAGGIGGYLLGTKKPSILAPTIVPKAATKYPVATISSELTNTKTYKDTALGFEFKYPSVLNLKLEEPDNYRLLQLINQNGAVVGSLVYYNNPDGLSLKEFENKLTSEDRSGQHVRVYTPTDEAINTATGEHGFLNKNGVYEPYPSDLFIFPKDKKIFVLIRYQNIAGEYKREDFVNQILSTFKFLDQNQSVDTTNWKTYRSEKSYKNGELKFEIKYPKEWQFLEKSESVEWYIQDPKNYLFSISWLNPDFIYDVEGLCRFGMCDKISEIKTKGDTDIEIWKPTPERKEHLSLADDYLHATISNSGKLIIPEFGTPSLKPEFFKNILSTFKFLD